MTENPLTQYPRPPFEEQPQGFPGRTGKMHPEPDHGEKSYRGSGRLAGKATLITGADSGIGRAVAIAFAREGADVAISFLEEEKDAHETARYVEEAGRRTILLPGDVADPAHCRDLVEKTVGAFGKLDTLVSNAAFQHPYQSMEECSDADFEKHFRTNVFAPFYLIKAALRHMRPGASIVSTASVNTKHPSSHLFAYAATKGALGNLTIGLAQLLAEKGIRVNAVLPGPIWTPFIPSGMEPEAIKNFGAKTPFGRPGQPAELASAYVMLASDESSYTSGALVTVAGGMPIF